MINLTEHAERRVAVARAPMPAPPRSTWSRCAAPMAPASRIRAYAPVPAVRGAAAEPPRTRRRRCTASRVRPYAAVAPQAADGPAVPDRRVEYGLIAAYERTPASTGTRVPAGVGI